MKMTEEMIQAGLSDNCASQAQLSIFGLYLKKGWRKELLGRECTFEQFKQYVDLKPISARQKRIAKTFFSASRLSPEDRRIQERYDKLKETGVIIGNKPIKTIKEEQKSVLLSANNRKRKDKKKRPKVTCFISELGKQHQESYTETLIGKVLSENKVKFIRECSFKELKYSNVTYPRFDFYLPDLFMVIEYDGQHHQQEDIKRMDDYKDRFCREHGIKVERFNGRHYDSLATHVYKALKKRSAFNPQKMKY